MRKKEQGAGKMDEIIQKHNKITDANSGMKIWS